MLRVVLVAAVVLAATSACAGEKLLRGPIPDWVRPIVVTPPPLGEDGPAVRMLLEDQQLNLEASGQSEFVETVTQVRTPLGLSTAGSLHLAWSPDTETLTVHHVRVQRGGKMIDILEKQDFTVIRRETNLELAMLDGVLSATLQPEGLQAGDVIDIAYTRHRLDPVLDGKAEHTLTGRTYGQVDRMRLRATWDDKRNIVWSAGSALDKVKLERRAGRVEVVVDMKDVDSVTFPAGAPRRLYPTRRLAVSEFKTWGEVSALMAPHYAKATQLEPNSPLHAEVARIRAASPDDRVRASQALQLVEDQVRYLALTMQFGGYLPATADETWRRRFGDCKAKTVLLMALLRELGIEADAAVVDSDGGHLLDIEPPGLGAFDHVIVRAVVGDKVYWLDGTRSGDRNIDALRVPAFGQALPLRPGGSALVALVQPAPDRPNSGVLLRVDARGGLDAPAPVHGELMLGGDMGHYMGLMSSNVPAADREKSFKQLWNAYPGIEAKSVSLTTDPATGHTKLVMDGTAKLEWLPRTNGPRWLFVPIASLGATTEFKREPGPLADAPWAVNGHPAWMSSTFQIVLPEVGEGFKIEGDDVDVKVAGRAYLRKSSVANGVATIETSVRTLAAEFPNEEAAAASETLKRLSRVRVGVRAPPYYRPTPADIEAWSTEAPKTADDLIGRGIRYATIRRHDLALVDLEKAVALDPKASYAWANLGVSHFWTEKYEQADADFAKAIELDPRNYVAVQGQAMLAMRDHRYADAITAYGRAADLRPNNTFAIVERARAHWAMGDGDKALVALEAAAKVEPRDERIRLLRFRIYEAQNQRERALSEIEAALVTAPGDSQLHLFRAGLLWRLGRRADADAAFDRAIAIRPTGAAYMTRYNYRDPSDIKGRLADIDLAEKAGTDTWTAARAETLADDGRFDEALAVLDRAIKSYPDGGNLVETRAEVLLRSGKTALGVKEIARLRARAAGNASRLNGLCWLGGTQNHDLQAALADCDAALKLRPVFGAAVDSRALVLLRLNRLPEALAAYDEAVRLLPDNPESLYGRGLVKLRMGRTVDGWADLAAARNGLPWVDSLFGRWGLRAPQSAEAAAPTQASAK